MARLTITQRGDRQVWRMTELGDGAFGTRSLVDLPTTIHLLRYLEVAIVAQGYKPSGGDPATIFSKHRTHSVA